MTATLVSKANAQGNQEELQDAVSQALVVGFCVSLLGTFLMLRYPEKVLSSVLREGAPALHYAKPYLFIRSFAFLPSLISLIGFSAFRGQLLFKDSHLDYLIPICLILTYLTLPNQFL